MSSNKRISIKDYIKDNGLKEYFVYRDKASELYPLFFNTPSGFKYRIGFMMFNFDSIFLSKGLEPSVVRPKNFDNLIKTIKSFIIEYKKLV